MTGITIITDNRFSEVIADAGSRAPSAGMAQPRAMTSEPCSFSRSVIKDYALTNTQGL